SRCLLFPLTVSLPQLGQVQKALPHALAGRAAHSAGLGAPMPFSSHSTVASSCMTRRSSSETRVSLSDTVVSGLALAYSGETYAPVLASRYLSITRSPAS